MLQTNNTKRSVWHRVHGITSATQKDYLASDEHVRNTNNVLTQAKRTHLIMLLNVTTV